MTMTTLREGSQRVLVTGATGTVGGHVVACLRDGPCEVCAASRHPEAATSRLNIPAVYFDFQDPASYRSAFDGQDALFLVRPPAIARVWTSIFPALDMAVDSGIRHIVFLSLQGAEANPFVPHRWIEWKLASIDVRATFLRPSFFMQNLTTTHRHEVADERTLILPAGDGHTALIDARDVADVAAHVIKHPKCGGGAYELTGLKAISYHTVARVLSDVLGQPIRYEEPSVIDFLRYSRRRGREWPFIFVMTGIYLTARFGLAARTTSTVHDLLGRPPRSFRTFAEDYAGVWAVAK
ncbi:NAD(P)-dependent oxidoreductase [Longibacter salinarum]|uniref:NAD(P)-dependent oxidoreductase n=1 Tax=Longibacter salinarum TaxID=1850348 RepID=A0A2A8CYJ1_9BACT|nr:NmrA family NAD(P)-binding protein [Longibacter salinarum]PEN13448.1 NAD(P)-dependent oxidoreductase [Longibacter salinarum]